MRVVRIRAKDGTEIDLADVRRDKVFVGNPYAMDMAILIRHNTALLDALEAALGVEAFPPLTPLEIRGYNTAIKHVRQAAGFIEDDQP
jgi:hypothetical protein